MKPEASVVVPTHGRLDLLRECLDSIKLQDFADWECFVVGDRPEEFDQKESLVSEFNDRRIKFVRNPRTGANSSRNLGVGLASGEYIFYIDDDDVWAPEKLRAHLRVHRSKQVEFVHSNFWLRYQNPNGQFSYDVSFEPPPNPGDLLRRAAHFLWCPATSSVVSVSRKRALSQPWDESLSSYQDWDVWFRLLRDGISVGYIEKPLAVFRQHSGERATKRLDLRLQTHGILFNKYPDELSWDSIASLRMRETCKRLSDLERFVDKAKLLASEVKHRRLGVRDLVSIKVLKTLPPRRRNSRAFLAIAFTSWLLQRKSFRVRIL